jgi:hypothetical protein
VATRQTRAGIAQLVWRWVRGWTARLQFLVGASDYFPLNIVQNVDGPMGIFPPGAKRPGREVDHSSPSSAALKNGGVISPLPYMTTSQLFF